MRLRVAFFAFLATWLFFYEYLPPWKTVHLFSDIEGYHYPLYNYAQKAFHEGRFPEWDVAEYSGLSFVGNPQAALFYPPNWLVYFANRMHDGVRFQTLEDLEFLHCWAAFLLAWLWLRRWTQTEMPAFAGAAVFAFSGYRMAESQHLGVICAYSWYPLALSGLDDAVRRNRWTPLWKTAAASALCLTAGYPPTWFVFCVCCLVYTAAIAPWRQLWRPVAAISFSLLLAMAQLAPVLEAAAMKAREKVYGPSIPGGAFFYLQFLLPNYYDQARSVGHLGPPWESYLYLGAAALLGCGWLLRRGLWRSMLPPGALFLAAMLFILNPAKIPEFVIESLPLVSEACRAWNFLAVFGLAAAMLTALGLDDLSRARLPRIAWWIPAAAALTWNARQWIVWREGGHFATGWWTALEAGLTLLVLCLLFLAPQRALVQAVILATVFIEFKVYGTSRRFNAATGSVDSMFAQDMRTGGPEMLAMNAAVYTRMRSDIDYRVVVDSGPHATELRFYRLATPAGFDPFLTAQYRQAVQQFVPFHTDREFIFDWSNAEMMDAFAVKYVITTPDAKNYAKLASDPRFRLMQPAEGYYRVFEYLAARPAFRFPGKARRVNWSPERRGFQVSSDSGGQFHLLEQFFPGWKAYVDGHPTRITRVRTTFQAIDVPAGSHSVEFRFRSTAMRAGIAVSLAAWLGGLFAVMRTRPRVRPPAPAT